jgi:hypothetical protein
MGVLGWILLGLVAGAIGGALLLLAIYSTLAVGSGPTRAKG